jgi:hypothetical protein
MSTPVEPKPSIKFLQFHQPALADGDYEITVTQTVKIADHPDIGAFTSTKYFTVAGDRFELKPTDIHAVFPPDGNLGRHTNVLPHIILNRSTLPWERTAESYAKGEHEEVTGVPWLALLLFDDDERPEPQTFTLGKLKTPAASVKFPDIKLETGQHDEDAVTWIDVPRNRLEKIMPSIVELKLLAHVRHRTDGETEPSGDELAVIIANRLPKAGAVTTAHLVSVEARFAKNDAHEFTFNYQKAAENDLIRLVTLKSWSFSCEDPKKDFKQQLLDLNKKAGGPATLRLPRSVPAADQLLARGYVPVPHYFRRGDETASWYHGPLIPDKATPTGLKLPARTSDELVRYDTKLAMFDVSYAAAWELGRLLALQDKAFATSLYQWKREHAQRLAQDEQRVPYLPFQKETPTDIPQEVADWFTSLRKLEGVPFNYLVPDERMLPAESIRFFRMDHTWIDCLADGAFSIGRIASSDHQNDKLLSDSSLATTAAAETITGFFMRSEVVSGWPGLLIEVFADQAGTIEVKPLRMERLAPGVLLGLFPGEIARVEVHLKPETLHFGLDEHGATFSKNLRDAKSGVLSGAAITLKPEHWRSAPHRILNVTAVADAIKAKLPSPHPLTSAQFALQMVEGVEKIIFVGKP